MTDQIARTPRRSKRMNVAIRYIATLPGTVLLEDVTKGEIVPHAALLNIVHASPAEDGALFRPRHALNRSPYHEAFDWVAPRELRIRGPSGAGAATESSGR